MLKSSVISGECLLSLVGNSISGSWELANMYLEYLNAIMRRNRRCHPSWPSTRLLFSFLLLLFLFSFFFPMCEYVRVCTNIPLGSRQYSFSADTFFFLSLFCFLNVWISKENSYQTLLQKKPTHKSLISMKYRFLPLWKKERKSEWMNEWMNLGLATLHVFALQCIAILLDY